MAFAAFEREILDLYEQKRLTPGLLDSLASKYQRSCISYPASKPLQVCGGKDLCQICIELLDPSFPLIARGDKEDHEEYWERELKKWEEILYIRWHWERECTSLPVQGQQNGTACFGG
jgi:hypothetical protein